MMIWITLIAKEKFISLSIIAFISTGLILPSGDIFHSTCTGKQHHWGWEQIPESEHQELPSVAFQLFRFGISYFASLNSAPNKTQEANTYQVFDYDINCINQGTLTTFNYTDRPPPPSWRCKPRVSLEAPPQPRGTHQTWCPPRACWRRRRWRSRSPRSPRGGSPRRRAAPRCWPRRCRRRRRCRCRWCCRCPSWPCWASSGCPAGCASPPSERPAGCCCGGRRPGMGLRSLPWELGRGGKKGLFEQAAAFSAWKQLSVGADALVREEILGIRACGNLLLSHIGLWLGGGIKNNPRNLKDH